MPTIGDEVYKQYGIREGLTAPIGAEPQPIPMLLWCPTCHERHVDLGEFAHKSHHTHACQHCGMVWRPARESTVGVQFLPGFRDADFKQMGKE